MSLTQLRKKVAELQKSETEHQQAEEALQENENYYRFLPGQNGTKRNSG